MNVQQQVMHRSITSTVFQNKTTQLALGKMVVWVKLVQKWRNFTWQINQCWLLVSHRTWTVCLWKSSVFTPTHPPRPPPYTEFTTLSLFHDYVDYIWINILNSTTTSQNAVWLDIWKYTCKPFFFINCWKFNKEKKINWVLKFCTFMAQNKSNKIHQWFIYQTPAEQAEYWFTAVTSWRGGKAVKKINSYGMIFSPPLSPQIDWFIINIIINYFCLLSQ